MAESLKFPWKYGHFVHV